MATRRYTWLARVLCLTVAYCVAGRLALLLAIPPGYATAVWPAAGVALVGVLAWGSGVWPGLVLGSFLVNIWTTMDSGGPTALGAVLTAVGIGIGAALQGIFGAWLVRRFVGFPNPLIKDAHIVAFCVLGGPVACLVAATWGVTTLNAAGIVRTEEYFVNWFTWWVGDTIGVLTVAPLLLVFGGEPRNVWRTRRNSVAVPTAATFAAAVMLYIGASRWEQRRIEADFVQQCRERGNVLRRNLEDSLHMLRAVVGLLNSSESVDRQEFRDFAQRMLGRHDGLQALSWDVRVPHSERERFELQARREGFPEFQITHRLETGQMVRAGERDEYVSVYFIEPLEGNELALGFDVSSEPTRLAAMQKARDAAVQVGTGPIKLVQEIADQPGFIVFDAIYANGQAHDSVAQRRANLQGFAVAVFRIEERIEKALVGFDQRGLEFEMWDDDAPPDKRLLYRSSPCEIANQDTPASAVRLSWSESFRVAERPRRMVWKATPAYLTAHRSLVPWSILAGGLLFTSLLGVMLLAQSGRTFRIEQIVQVRTADLQRTGQALADLNAELARVSRIDGLTGVMLRPAWEEAIRLEHQRSVRYGHSYAVIMLDVDFFKKLNDSLGHQCGDTSLREVAQCAARTCRTMDLVGRYGGEEFVILLPETSLPGATELAERICRAVYDLNLPHPQSSVANRVTVSMGVTAFSSGTDYRNWEDVVNVADQALYRAKAGGRNRVVSSHEPTIPMDQVVSRGARHAGSVRDSADTPLSAKVEG